MGSNETETPAPANDNFRPAVPLHQGVMLTDETVEIDRDELHRIPVKPGRPGQLKNPFIEGPDSLTAATEANADEFFARAIENLSIAVAIKRSIVERDEREIGALAGILREIDPESLEEEILETARHMYNSGVRWVSRA